MITHLSLCLLLVAWPPLFEAKAVSQQDHVKDAASESQSASHFLQIARKSCLGADGRPGTCMFNFQCQQLRGQVVAPCLDGFLFGACCHLSDDKAIASVITSAVQAAGIRPSVPLPYLSPVSLSWRDELSTASFDADELLLEVDASAASVRQPGLEDSALFNSNADSSVDSGEDWTEQPERIEETTIRIPATAGPDDQPHSDIEAIEVSQPVSNQISSVDDRLDESAGIISPSAALTQLASSTSAPTTTTTQSTAVQETTTTAPTSSAATEHLQTTRSPDGGKPAKSPVLHPVNILQYLVSNPPAWVIQELLNGTSSPTTSQDVADSLESSSVEEPSAQSSPPTTSASPATTEVTTTTRKPHPVFDYKKDCGVRPLVRKGRIVGGRRSDYGKWPWQVLIRESTWFFRSKKKCGGVLISDRHVLTAAHCKPGLFSSLMVVLGEFDVSGGSEPHTTVEKNVKRVVVHKDYVERTFENDLAILELETPVEFRPYIVPICLPSTSDGDFYGQKAEVTGWGRLSHNGPTPGVLYEVDVPILTNKECHDMFRKSGHEKRILDSFICAGYKEGKKDACEGDSGGPMMLERDDGRWTLVGTVSNGIGCANPNMPGIYMRMTYYRPWIERVTGLSGQQLG